MSRSAISRDTLRRIVLIALFGAVSYVVMVLIHFPVSILTLDVKDAVITLCGLYFGPLGAIVLSVTVPLLEMITVSQTGPYGLFMNIISTAALAIPASVIYKYKKDFFGAIIGLISGVCTMIAVMMAFNLLITPLYLTSLGTPTTAKDVMKMIPTLLLPFNSVKGVLNASLVLMLYKPLSEILQRAGFLPKSSKPFKFDTRTVIVTVVSLVLVIVSFVIIFTVLHGSFEFGIG